VRQAQIVRRVALTAIALVTAWSVWAWAQPREHDPARGHEQAQEHAEEGSEEAPSMNLFEFGRETPPFIAMLVNFGILAGAYYLLGRRPIAAGLQNRRNAIAKDIDDAQAMKRAAEERAKTYQGKLETLEQEMRTAREALVRAGEAERDRLITEAEANAERMRKDAAFLVTQELKQIRQDLRKDMVNAAVGMAEHLLRERVTPADQERLAEEYLADLGGEPEPGARIPAQERAP
jgi:F-type H+-transporting ATPase subunit b